MQFHLGRIPDSPDVDPIEGSWKPMREPSLLWCDIISIPAVFFVQILFAVIWFWATPWDPSGLDFEWKTFIAINLTPFLIHEFIHIAIHPGGIAKPNSVLGCWPIYLIFYAHYDGPLSKERFMATLIMPFCLLTLLPLLCGILFELDSSLLFLLSIINAGGSCLDLLGFLLIAWQVPSHAVMRNKGWRSYYQVNDRSRG